MAGSLEAAFEWARTQMGEARWVVASPGERSAAIYHQLCRIDSGCQRQGTAADMLLPPCQASASFIGRRACRAAGPRGAIAAE